MASKAKTTKRKNTAESLKPTKKIKQISKSAKGTGNVEKSTLSKKILKATSSSTSAAPKRPRKRTADLLEDDHTSEVTSSKPTNTSTSSKRAKKDGEVMAVTKSGKKTFKEGEEVAITEANHEDSADSDNGLNEDQTAALLAGFESSDEDGDSDEGEANGPEPEGLSLQQLPDIPDEGKEQNQNKAKSGKVGEGPGVIYIGRIPHGFYEPQMRAYFSQFGKIKRLRLSRNRKTGRSKHYAFIEFASAEVADIVARTMNKYLMFGHILQVAVIPPAQVHEKLFLGANKRFRPVPRNKLEGKRLKEGAEREEWTRRLDMEKKRRYEKKKKMQDIGYDFGFPRLTDVSSVPVKDSKTGEVPGGEPRNENAESKVSSDANGTEEQDTTKAIEDTPEIAQFTEEATIKKETRSGKKIKKTKKTAVAVV